MAYKGEITYMDIPYAEVEWSDAVHYAFRHPTINRRSAKLPARKLLLDNTSKERERLIFDEKDRTDIQGLKCIVIGRKILANGRSKEQEHYVLVVEPTPSGDYERVGVGSVQRGHISFMEIDFVTMMVAHSLQLGGKVTDDLEIREAFKLVDRDGNGFILAAELRHTMTNIGEKLTDEEVDEMIAEAGLDGDGRISFEEFAIMIAQDTTNSDSEETKLEAFKLFDLDRGGFISADEMRHVMRSMGSTLPDYEIDEIIREGDLDADGLLNYKEFTQMTAEVESFI